MSKMSLIPDVSVVKVVAVITVPSELNKILEYLNKNNSCQNIIDLVACL